MWGSGKSLGERAYNDGHDMRIVHIITGRPPLGDEELLRLAELWDEHDYMNFRRAFHRADAHYRKEFLVGYTGYKENR